LLLELEELSGRALNFIGVIAELSTEQLAGHIAVTRRAEDLNTLLAQPLKRDSPGQRRNI